MFSLYDMPHRQLSLAQYANARRRLPKAAASRAIGDYFGFLNMSGSPRPPADRGARMHALGFLVRKESDGHRVARTKEFLTSLQCIGALFGHGHGPRVQVLVR